MKTIYLAGFDVFRSDSLAHGAWLKQQCRIYGFEGLYPLDNEAPRSLAGPALAQWIYDANVALIHQADAVMANLNMFRGAEPDSGTAFEVGFAVALGKPVWAYLDTSTSLVDRLAVREEGELPRYVDKEGYTVEDFGLSLNLMLACSATLIEGDATACLARMAQSLA